MIGQKDEQLGQRHHLVHEGWQQIPEQVPCCRPVTAEYERAGVRHIPVVVTWNDEAKPQGKHQETSGEQELRGGMARDIQRAFDEPAPVHGYHILCSPRHLVQTPHRASATEHGPSSKDPRISRPSSRP